MDQVMGSSYFLTEVLSYLSIPELIKATHVCSDWKEEIMTRKSLRSILSLESHEKRATWRGISERSYHSIRYLCNEHITPEQKMGGDYEEGELVAVHPLFNKLTRSNGYCIKSLWRYFRHDSHLPTIYDDMLVMQGHSSKISVSVQGCDNLPVKIITASRWTFSDIRTCAVRASMMHAKCQSRKLECAKWVALMVKHPLHTRSDIAVCDTCLRESEEREESLQN
ncbi:Hypothetical protein D9617_18g033380 [Elsinoe fawcettii]|nr:Hypothetical protein D9617_18g033380 [Elsinoe fawcettii]